MANDNVRVQLFSMQLYDVGYGVQELSCRGPMCSSVRYRQNRLSCTGTGRQPVLCPRTQWIPRSQDAHVNRLAAPPLVGAKAQARDIT